MTEKKNTSTDVESEKGKKVTKSSIIWDKIKDNTLEIYALPDQTISDHVKREEEMELVNSDSLYLTLKSAAVLPALESALNQIRLPKGERFDVSQVSSYIVVQIVPKY